MSGRRLQHLERRQGTYYVRLPVPIDLASTVGRGELRWSLHTRDARRGARLALAATVAFREFCAKLRRMTDAPDDALRTAVKAFFLERLKQGQEPPRFSGAAQADHRDYAIDMSRELITGLQAVVDSELYDGNPDDPTGAAAAAIADSARQVAEKMQFKLDALPEPERLMLFQGVARALIEEQRHFIHNLTDRLSPYQPADGFLAGAYVEGGSQPSAGAKTTVSAAVAAYIAAKAGVNWTPRTELEKRRVLRWVEEYFGAETPLDAITKERVRAFRDALVKLRFKGLAHAPFAELIGETEQGAV